MNLLQDAIHLSSEPKSKISHYKKYLKMLDKDADKYLEIYKGDFPEKEFVSSLDHAQPWDTSWSDSDKWDELRLRAAKTKEKVDFLYEELYLEHERPRKKLKKYKRMSRLYDDLEADLLHLKIIKNSFKQVKESFVPDRGGRRKSRKKRRKRKSRNKRKKRKTRKRKGGLPECGMVEKPDEWCKDQAKNSGNIEDNENTMCNINTGKCVKPPAFPSNFRSQQGRRAYQRIQARRDLTVGGRKKKRKRRKTKRRRR